MESGKFLFVLCHMFLCASSWEVRTPDRFLDDNQVDERILAIFPGTKWCGSGSTADNENDLGYHNETDACCREHDNCPDYIESGGTNHNLTNDALYTRVHCDCDDKFHQCLRNSSTGTQTSIVVGILYFDALQTKCFKNEFPIISCKTYSPVLRRCQEYFLNETADKQWQWFDVPLF